MVARSTNQIVLESFSELIRTKDFSKITVSDICVKAGISRKTFYAHFADKDELVEKVIRRDIIQPVSELRRLLHAEEMKSAPQLVTETMYRSIYDNKSFYSSLFTNGGRDIFMKAVGDEINKFNRSLLAQSTLPEPEQEYMAYFFASSQTMLLIKWIKDGFIVTPQQIARYYYNWGLKNWAEITGQMRNWGRPRGGGGGH